ncbi:MAG TPA: TIGR01777 family oxidoreductase [Candidatus Bathyarchaeia archaeon]|nr:TIGR01777 family oxidoreductase [Candidatus Bathyarchaeia archaeon]
MRILISGASGLIGSALRPALAAAGHATAALVRGASASEDVQWKPGAWLDPQAIGGFDAIAHLAGKNISGRWTEEFKRAVLESRVEGTRTVATAAAESFRARGAPRVLVAASAIGYYGNRGEEVLTESSGPGEGFSSYLCEAWEAAALPAVEAGMRVVTLRIGVVLAKEGGALKAMLPAFRLGLGGRVGDGQQYWSWVALDDAAGAMAFALTDDSLSGVVNAVAPQPVRNREFACELGRALQRPAIFPVPGLVVRMAFGEMGEELLLASARVSSGKLEAAGYGFRHPRLAEALATIFS